jgi:hypothetical protein
MSMCMTYARRLWHAGGLMVSRGPLAAFFGAVGCRSLR